MAVCRRQVPSRRADRHPIEQHVFAPSWRPAGGRVPSTLPLNGTWPLRRPGRPTRGAPWPGRRAPARRPPDPCRGQLDALLQGTLCARQLVALEVDNTQAQSGNPLAGSAWPGPAAIARQPDRAARLRPDDCGARPIPPDGSAPARCSSCCRRGRSLACASRRCWSATSSSPSPNRLSSARIKIGKAAEKRAALRQQFERALGQPHTLGRLSLVGGHQRAIGGDGPADRCHSRRPAAHPAAAPRLVRAASPANSSAPAS